MSVIGSWDVTIQTPFGEQVVTLEFSDEHTGVASYGSETIGLQGVTTSGDNATWTVSLVQPMSVTLKCTVETDGDSMSGTASVTSVPMVRRASRRFT